MNPVIDRRIGLLAGSGDIPVYFARRASQNGIRLISIGFSDAIQSHLAPFSEKSYSIGLGRHVAGLDQARIDAARCHRDAPHAATLAGV